MAFAEFFKLGFCHGDSLRQLCHELNIHLSEQPMPKLLKGYHHRCKGQRIIIISTDQAIPGASFEHTVLHELRELMEHIFEDLKAVTATGAELEQRAEQFASSVRVLSASNGIVSLFEDIPAATSWKQRLAYVAIALLGIFYIGTCVFLPYLEDHFSQS